MQDHVSRLVGLEGFEVKGVIEEGGQLDLEVELAARAGCCPGCGRSSVEVKERPVVRVRDQDPLFHPTEERTNHELDNPEAAHCASMPFGDHSFTVEAAGDAVTLRERAIALERAAAAPLLKLVGAAAVAASKLGGRRPRRARAEPRGAVQELAKGLKSVASSADTTWHGPRIRCP